MTGNIINMSCLLSDCKDNSFNLLLLDMFLS